MPSKHQVMVVILFGALVVPFTGKAESPDLTLAAAINTAGLQRDVEQEDFWRQRASIHRANHQ